MVNHYSDIYRLLQDHGYFFNEEITVGNGGEVCTGLVAYCSPILSGGRVEKIKEIVGENYSVVYFPNIQELQIKLKK